MSTLPMDDVLTALASIPGGASVKHIHRYLDAAVSESTTRRQLAVMVDRGWVERRLTRRDRFYVVRWELTEQGRLEVSARGLRHRRI